VGLDKRWRNGSFEASNVFLRFLSLLLVHSAGSMASETQKEEKEDWGNAGKPLHLFMHILLGGFSKENVKLGAREQGLGKKYRWGVGLEMNHLDQRMREKARLLSHDGATTTR